MHADPRQKPCSLALSSWCAQPFLAQVVGSVVERSQLAVVIVAQLACTALYEVVANGCHSVDEMLRSHLLAIEQPVHLAFNAYGEAAAHVSNASGGMNPAFHVGDLMIIDDHINFFPEHPLQGKNFPTGPRFPDMHEAYDKGLRDLADGIAKEVGIEVKHGVYVGVQGPTFETPAEYRMYRILGGDAVGMSTVPEVIVARHCGIKVFGISIITDLGGFDVPVQVSHEEVQIAANNAQPKMTEIMREMIRRS